MEKVDELLKMGMVAALTAVKETLHQYEEGMTAADVQEMITEIDVQLGLKEVELQLLQSA